MDLIYMSQIPVHLINLPPQNESGIFLFFLWLQYSLADIQLLLKALHKHFSWYLRGYSEPLYFSSEWINFDGARFANLHDSNTWELHRCASSKSLEWFAGFLKVEIVIKCLFRQQMYCSSFPAYWVLQTGAHLIVSNVFNTMVYPIN